MPYQTGRRRLAAALLRMLPGHRREPDRHQRPGPHTRFRGDPMPGRRLLSWPLTCWIGRQAS